MIRVPRGALMGAFLSLFVALAACGTKGDATTMISDVRSDETIVFFRTAGWLDTARDEWHLPVYGWIFEPEESSVRLTAFREVLESSFDLNIDEQYEGNFSRRTNLLIADNERGKRIVVEIAGRQHALPASAENGHFQGTVVIPAAELRTHANDGYVRYTAITPAGESRSFTGEVKLVEPSGVSVISDIDDTVKISNVTDRRRLMEQTFLRDFDAAPGMAELYRQWSSEDVSFHYVSSSPWQLYPPLREFLDEAGFPWATFSLKAIRFRDESLLDLFKDGTETKPAAIESILDRYPDRKFVLVGDSGEQDPEVYASLLRKHPTQILRVCIRNVTGEEADNDRFSTVFAGVGSDQWQLFTEPQTLECF